MSAQSPRTQFPEDLTSVISFDADGRAVFPAGWAGQAMSERLDASLLLVFPDCGSEVECACAEAVPPIVTFGDLLLHRAPPAELLELVKEYAKVCRMEQQSPLAPEMSLLIYYASIACALVRHARRISRLGDEELQRCFTWAIRQPWVEGNLRELFAEGLEYLRGGRGKWRE